MRSRQGRLNWTTIGRTMGELVTGIIGLAAVGTLVLLIVQRWFWIVVFFIAGLASAFTVLASIVHFQILGALLFTFVTVICWGAAAWIADL